MAAAAGKHLGIRVSRVLPKVGLTIGPHREPGVPMGSQTERGSYSAERAEHLLDTALAWVLGFCVQAYFGLRSLSQGLGPSSPQCLSSDVLFGEQE